jgi:hypothetical protein
MKQEWKEIANGNGITQIIAKSIEELDELKTELQACQSEDFLPGKRFDSLCSEIADVKACIQQIVFWLDIGKPVKAMMHYKAVRQHWRCDHE